MTFLNPSPSEEQEYLRRASLAIRAADALASIKLMSIERQLANLGATMRADEHTSDAVDVESSERYLELVRLKGHYGSAEGHDKLRMEILTEMFKKELAQDV